MKPDDQILNAIKEYPDLKRLPSKKAILYAYQYRQEMQRYATQDYMTLGADTFFLFDYANDIRIGENLSFSRPPLDLPNIEIIQHNKCGRCKKETNDCYPICHECVKDFKTYDLYFEDLKQRKLAEVVTDG